MDASEVSVDISPSMLPATRAIVLNRKVWKAIGILLFFGAMNLVSDIFAFQGGAYSQAAARPRLLAILYWCGVAVRSVTLLLGLVALANPHPRTLRFDGIAIIIMGVWCLLWPFLAMIVYRVEGMEAEFEYGLLIAGGFQIAFGIRELRRFNRVASWLPDAEKVTPGQISAVKLRLKAFVKQDESFNDARIKGAVADRAFLGRGNKKHFRGRLFDDQAIVVAKQLDDCYCISRQDAAAANYKKSGGLDFPTDQGIRTLWFGELSRVIFKLWAGAPVSQGDLRRVVTMRMATIELLKVFLSGEDPLLRTVAVGGLQNFRDDPEAGVLATERLADPDPGVRTAALAACKDLHLDSLQDQAIGLLQDAEPAVRGAAAAYVSAYPTAEAAEPLRIALQGEQDSGARRKIGRAIKACQKLYENPYGAS